MTEGKRLANAIELLRDARDAAMDAHPDQEDYDALEAVLEALGDTWVPEILPHCHLCASPLDDAGDCSASCVSVKVLPVAEAGLMELGLEARSGIFDEGGKDGDR